MKWSVLKKGLQEQYHISHAAKECGSFESLVRLLMRSLGNERPLFPEDEVEENTARFVLDQMTKVCLGCPPQYVTGKAFFDVGVFFVGDGVLIPRPDTEILVEQTVRLLPKNGLFYDLCCGSGCVGISVLLHRPDVKCVALDIADAALYYTQKNAAYNAVDRRMTILKQDVLAPCPPGFIQGDLVVANPPYLSGIEIDQLSSVVRKEPVLALYGGENGLDFYQNIFKEYAHLGKGVLVEIGHTQADAVNVLAHKLGFDRVSVFRDYGGRDRVVYCEKK